jgi:predicted RNA-binding Zn ribbon-like protein
MTDWIWDGGRLCVDFLNTVRERRTKPRECLATPADLAGWLHQAGLAPVADTRLRAGRSPVVESPVGAGVTSVTDAWLRAGPDRVVPVTEAQLRAARALRESIDRVLFAEVPRTQDVDLLNRWARAAHRRPPQLRVDPDGSVRAWSEAPADPVRAALGALAVDAIRLRTEDPAARIAVCGASTCGLRFVDTSPAGRRQWCSMRRCGNREKARLHYRRRTDP